MSTIWDNYTNPSFTMRGQLLVSRDFYSPQLDNKRDIYVWLPPKYDERERRYPVFYMQDGQNLFDDALAANGSWGLDKTLATLARDSDLPVIIVGISNIGDTRIAEYNPWDHPQLGVGRGDAYLNFVIDTLKPVIDSDFHTLPERQTTGIGGSSLGGLIAHYAFFQRRDIFDLALVMSPSLQVARPNAYHLVKANARPEGRYYIDMGSHEAMNVIEGGWLYRYWYSWRMVGLARKMVRILARLGFNFGIDLQLVIEPEGIHHEKNWARRAPEAFRFLLKESE